MAGSKTTRKPPTMRELLDDPIYKKMLLTIPQNDNWAVYALKTNGRWVGRIYESYREAFEMMRTIIAPMNREHYRDVSLVSRASLHQPPVKFIWETHTFDWCGRCRRPTTYKRDQGLHALRDAPILSTDEPYRCFYCGMRKINQPGYSPIMYTPEELAAQQKAEQEAVNDQPARGRRPRTTAAQK